MNDLHGIVFAYKERPNLRELVEHRVSGAMPFGGRYRTVDFALSSLMNAGCSDVGVVVNGRYQSLLDHIGTGKTWDMSRRRGGLRILPPTTSIGNRGILPFRGKMEALAGIRDYLSKIKQTYVVMLESDLVANLPVSDIVKQHISTGADITVICGNDSFLTEHGTYYEADKDGRVTDVLVDLNTPRGFRGLDGYIISTELLKKLVEECYSKNQFSWRRDVLLAQKDTLKIQTYIWNGYAAQIRSVLEYYDRSMQLLTPSIRTELFAPERPIRAASEGRTSTYVGDAGKCINSLVGEGCRIEGTVVNSVLFPGVTVEAGAVVQNSVLFLDTTVGADANLNYVIADKESEVMTHRTIMGAPNYPIILSKGIKV